MVVSFIGCNADILFNTEKAEKAVLTILDKYVGDKECSFYLTEYDVFDWFIKKCCRKYADFQPNCKLVLIKNKADKKTALGEYDQILRPPLNISEEEFYLNRKKMWITDNSDIIVSHMCYGGAYKDILFFARANNKNIIKIADFYN